MFKNLSICSDEYFYISNYRGFWNNQFKYQYLCEYFKNIGNKNCKKLNNIEIKILIPKKQCNYLLSWFSNIINIQNEINYNDEYYPAKILCGCADIKVIRKDNENYKYDIKNINFLNQNNTINCEIDDINIINALKDYENQSELFKSMFPEFYFETKHNSDNYSTKFDIEFIETKNKKCDRCYRYDVKNNESNLCFRCKHFMNEYLQGSI